MLLKSSVSEILVGRRVLQCSAMPRDMSRCSHVDSSYAALLRLANCQNWITQLRAHAHAAWNRSERHQSLLKTGSWSTSHTRLAFPDILQERGPATALHATGGVYVGSLPSDGPCQKALNMRRRTILTPSAWRATVVQGP